MSTAAGRRVATGTRRRWDSQGKDRRDAHGCRIRRRRTAAIPVLRTRMMRMAQTGLTASGTTIRNTALPKADPAAVYQAMPIGPPARNLRKTIV